MILYVPERTKLCFQFKTCVSLMHTNWHAVGCFFWPRENGQEFSLMSGERSFLNLFRDSRTPLDSIRNKLVTLIYFVIVQCPSVGTTWYSARDLRLPRRTSGSALSADCQTLDVFVIVKVLFRIPQQLIIAKIRKCNWVRCNSLRFC